MKSVNFEIILKSVAFVATIAVVVVGGNMIYRSWAIDNCSTNNRYVRTEQNDSVTHVFDETSQGPFQKCLELKGFK